MKGVKYMSEILFKRVTELCEMKGISKRKLQEEMEMSIGSLSKWKTSTPSQSLLQKVADYFGVTADYLEGKSPYMNQDHMMKYWQEKYGNVDNKPDIMLPDGTILEFKGVGDGVTIHTTSGNVEYVYIDPETRRIAEYIQSNDKMKEMLEHIMTMNPKQFDTIYNMVMFIN